MLKIRRAHESMRFKRDRFQGEPAELLVAVGSMPRRLFVLPSCEMRNKVETPKARVCPTIDYFDNAGSIRTEYSVFSKIDSLNTCYELTLSRAFRNFIAQS